YFRLDGVTLVIPPLRERREQIGPLSLRFLKEAHERQKARAPLRWAPDLIARLEAHDWPGNVRELKAVLERAVLLSRGREVGPRQISLAEMAPATHEKAPSG